VRLDVSEVILHPEYRDPAYGIGKDGPKVFRSGDPNIHVLLKSI
jgi:hypothetical protein